MVIWNQKDLPHIRSIFLLINMLSQEEKKYWIAFTNIYSIGPKKFKRIRKYFGSMKTAWNASYTELQRAGLMPKDVQAVLTDRKNINPDILLEKNEKLNISIIDITDDRYPSLLKEIYSPPQILYILGSLPQEEYTHISVVGTRKTSAYGRHITPMLVSELSQAGFTIVSGIALGIDALAHQAALTSGTQTIAVLGCGLDITYPVSNRKLASDIIAHGGAIISEYPIGTKPLKQHFPARNRIISGLSRGVVVIEGGEDSGSLITASCALEQNREVFAVPGNISNTTSQGPNKLLKMGATVVTSAQDILDVLHVSKPLCSKKILSVPATDEEKLILEILSAEPLHIDEIIRTCKLNTSTTNKVLTLLEIKGNITNIGNNQYIRSR